MFFLIVIFLTILSIHLTPTFLVLMDFGGLISPQTILTLIVFKVHVFGQKTTYVFIYRLSSSLPTETATIK